MKRLALLTAALTLLAVGLATAAGGLTKVTKKGMVRGTAPGQISEKRLSARCPKGRSAVAGGFDSQYDPGDFVARAVVIANGPAGRAWSARAVSGFPNGGEFSVTALCSRSEPRAIRSASTRIAPDETGKVTATCRKGTQLVGIGSSGQLVAGDAGANVVTVVTGAYRQNPRTAIVKGLNAPNGPEPRAGRLTVRAVCADTERLRADGAVNFVDPGTAKVVEAGCGRDRAVFGGFDVQSTAPVPVSERQYFASRSMPAGRNTWRVRGVNDTNGPEAESARVKSFVYCG